VNFVTGKITQIEKQKKYRNRFSIYIEGKFTLGLDAEILAHRNLLVGQILTPKEISDLQNEDERKRGKISALRILARRDQSEKELQKKLVEKGFSKKAVQWVLSDLKNNRFLNDQTFAEHYAKNRLIQHPAGKRQLAYELKRKGIPESLSEETIEKVYSEFDEEKLAQKLALKKIKTLGNQPVLKQKKKVSDFLIRRGFDWEIVREILNDLIDDKVD